MKEDKGDKQDGGLNIVQICNLYVADYVWIQIQTHMLDLTSPQYFRNAEFLTTGKSMWTSVAA
jgi:hypothetical protein